MELFLVVNELAQQVQDFPKPVFTTYAVRKALEIIARVKGDLDLKIEEEKPVLNLYATALIIEIEGTDYLVSVQCDPRVSGYAFCESAIISKSMTKFITDEAVTGYEGQTHRHKDEKVFEDYMSAALPRLAALKNSNSAVPEKEKEKDTDADRGDGDKKDQETEAK